MSKQPSNMFILQKLLIMLILCPSLIICGATGNALKHYIVYMGDVTHPTEEAAISSNQELHAKVTTARVGVNDGIIHHYAKSFRGFSALLTPEEATSLSEMDEVISVFESKTRRVDTTRSWEFMGLDQPSYVGKSMYSDDYVKAQSDVIIGIIDGGVWPESKSFSDAGLPPVPSRFKGTCQTGPDFDANHCNRKIIGARFYFKGYEAENGPLESDGALFFRSPRDAEGHGVHTASTAGGALVDNANTYGLGKGTARGGAPGARVAIYKACWFILCNDADLLAAFNDAVDDGVDVISLSVGSGLPLPPYFEDVVSIGAFHAFRKGILTSASAGNDGLPGSVANVAPWIFTVAASSIDRSFSTNVVLANNVVLKGGAINPYPQSGFTDLVAGSSSAAPGISQTNASLCLESTLDPSKVKGKIVVCTVSGLTDRKALKGDVVKEAGGVGIIVIDPFKKDVVIQFVIPGSQIGAEQGAQLMAYMASTKNPKAYIKTTSTILNVSPAPQMAVFSSLGPNSLTPDIIKPDITAPGVNILAAWSPVSLSFSGNRSLDFNIISGTSMSCPHVSGLSAFIKSQHPTWGPAAIQSAIMTTAFVTDKENKPIIRNPAGNITGPFDYGSGHINPMAALDPGLVYDSDVTDMVKFLCGIGATPAQLRNLTGDGTRCMANPPPPYNLNYPSIAVANLKGSTTVLRTLTNYGSGSYVYKAVVQPPPGVYVEVLPSVLKFNKMGDKVSFTVKFSVMKAASQFVFGSLTWSDGKHKVYSPIAVNPILA